IYSQCAGFSVNVYLISLMNYGRCAGQHHPSQCSAIFYRLTQSREIAGQLPV
ncbi:hypothetical protein BDQ94DRAFT_155497, partial [Aspergillus welwitschiae]